MPWHGRLPSCWTSEPLKRLTAHGFQNGTWGSEPGESEHDVVCVRAADFDRTALRVSPDKMPTRSVTGTEWRTRQLRKGDIVLEKSGGGDQQPVGKAVLFALDVPAVCSNFQASARPADGVDSRYLTYTLEAMYQTGIATCCIKQTTGLQNLDSTAYLTTATPRPPSDIQSSIADVLDAETGRIDSLIDRKQRFIDLLLEKRTALITHAVTKGLDPDVDMKDSGVPWIGDIPAHWSVMRLRHLCDVSTGGRDTVDADPDAAYPFFVRSQTVERIDTYSFDGEAVLTAGDGAGVAKVFHYFVGKFDYHQRVYAFTRFRHVSGHFFFHFIRENFFKVALDGAAKSTVDSLRRPMILDFWMTVPPGTEQAAVVEYVHRESSQMDALIEKTRHSIDLLREYRAALISAAVTGQIDIPVTDASEEVS